MFPLGFIFWGLVSLEDIQFEELELDENSELQIPAFQSIVIQKLVVKDGAKIRLAQQSSGANGSFGSASRAGDGARSKIFIADLSGHLIVEARGGDGFSGFGGRNGKQGLDGADGRRARTLFGGLIYLGNGEDGAPGGPGEDGEDGGNGGDGGRGGMVEIYYHSKDPSASVIVNVDGGRGGQGGLPGLGGLGGNGGRGGRGIKDGEQGRLGLQGRHGMPGLAGQPGQAGEAYVFQLSLSFFRCLMALQARLSVEVLSNEDFDECRSMEAWPQILGHTPALGSVPFHFDGEGKMYLSADGVAGEPAIPAILPGATPASGSSGGSGGAITLILKDIPTHTYISARGGDGGAGADGVKGRDGFNGENGRMPFVFKRGAPDEVGTPGKPGGNGQSGGSGSNGGNGGPGGFVKIILISERPLENWHTFFDIQVDGGERGAAGRAAPGGLAGRGGLGKVKGLDGKEGVSGQHGLVGAAGPFGRIEFSESRSYADLVISQFLRQTE